VLQVVADAYVKLLQRTVLPYVVSIVARLGSLDAAQARALGKRVGLVAICPTPRVTDPRPPVIALMAAPSSYFESSSDRTIASVHVMSTLSPTFTFARASLSSTRLLYDQPRGPVNVIEGVFGSIAVMVAVIVC
jgi:hypothetical protein